MLIPVIRSIAASTVSSVVQWNRNRARARQQASVITYLEGMPDYLRRDIGLTDEICLAAAVERGIPLGTSAREARRDLIMTPHAA